MRFQLEYCLGNIKGGFLALRLCLGLEVFLPIFQVMEIKS